jgi:hypothetical protein
MKIEEENHGDRQNGVLAAGSWVLVLFERAQSGYHVASDRKQELLNRIGSINNSLTKV